MSTITQEQLWQLLELVASPDCDLDTDLLAEALDKAINGSQDGKAEGIATILGEMEKLFAK